MTAPLHGIRVVELEAPGPVAWVGMMLSDLGAHVTRIVRPGSAAPDLRSDWLLRGRETRRAGPQGRDRPAQRPGSRRVCRRGPRRHAPRVRIVVASIELEFLDSSLIDGGRLWSLWSKVGAVGNADALSTASRPVREAHRPQILSLAGAEGAGPPPAGFHHGGDIERTNWLGTDRSSRTARLRGCCRRRALRHRLWRVKSE